jgi:hypothetical protein
VLFKCDWVDSRVQGRWVKTDQFGITSVNLNHLFNTGERLLDEPFIFASQASKFTMFLTITIKTGVVLCNRNHVTFTICLQ